MNIIYKRFKVAAEIVRYLLDSVIGAQEHRRRQAQHGDYISHHPACFIPGTLIFAEAGGVPLAILILSLLLLS
jgi:hypothetical protein